MEAKMLNKRNVILDSDGVNPTLGKKPPRPPQNKRVPVIGSRYSVRENNTRFFLYVEKDLMPLGYYIPVLSSGKIMLRTLNPGDKTKDAVNLIAHNTGGKDRGARLNMSIRKGKVFITDPDWRANGKTMPVERVDRMENGWVFHCPFLEYQPSS
jgi:hypothetical protein